MAESMTDTELGGILLTLRGVQWIMGTKGDPYALLLRSGSDDPDELGARIRDRGELWWSHADTWVTGRYAIGRAVLDDPRLQARSATVEPIAAAQTERMPWDLPSLDQALPMDDAGLLLDRADLANLAELWRFADADPDPGELDALYNRAVSAPAGAYDLFADVLAPTARQALARVLGLRGGAAEAFAAHATAAAGALDATVCPPQLSAARRLRDALTDLRAVIDEALASPPPSGPLAVLAGADRRDAATLLTLHAVVGGELAANLAGNTVATLLDGGDWARLTADPGLAGAAVRETERYCPPVRLRRLVAREQTEIAGATVEPDAEVVVVLSSANRDPEVFTDPDRFDLGRHGLEPLTLAGLPGAIVAPLARAQARAAVGALAARRPGLAAAGPVLRRLRSPVTGGLLHLPVSTR